MESESSEIGMWTFRRAGLCQAGPAGITNTMFWNEIRNHIRERLPAIVDFILFGMALFWLGVVSVCGIGLLSGRRAPVYLAEDDSRLWDDKATLLPPGRQALPPAAAPQIGRSRRPALPDPKK